MYFQEIFSNLIYFTLDIKDYKRHLSNLTRLESLMEYITFLCVCRKHWI